MLEFERLFENDHTAIRVNDARVRLDGNARAVGGVPFEFDGNARIHAATATIFAIARADSFRFARLKFTYGSRHNCLCKAMLELGRKTVNRTEVMGCGSNS